MPGISAARCLWFGRSRDGNPVLFTAVFFLILILFGACNRQQKRSVNAQSGDAINNCEAATLALLDKAVYLNRQTFYDSSLVYLTNLEKNPAYAWSKNPACYIRLKQQLGITYSLLADFPLALEQLYSAFGIADSIDSHNLKIEIYTDEAEVFRKQSLFGEAVKRIKLADSIIQRNGAGVATMAYYLDRNVALYFIRFPSNPSDSSFAENRRAIVYARLAGNAYLEASALNEMGARFRGLNNDSADAYFHSAGLIFDSLGCYRDLANTLLNIAWNERRAKRCLKYLDSCRAIIGNNKWWYLSNILEDYYAYYYQTIVPNRDSALKYLTIQKEISNIVNHQIIESIQASARADNERKNQLIISNRELREEYKRRQFTFLVSGILLAIAAVLLFFWLRKQYAFRKLKESSDQLSVANAQLAQNLEEKAILVNEIHHRVKNNFQLIASLLIRQAIQQGNPALKTEFEKARLRLLGMSTVHDLIYHHSDEGLVNLPEFLQAICREMLATFEVDGPENLHLDCELQTVTHADAVHWGIVLQELITNSGKYARTQGKELELNISIKCKDSTVYFTYNDNGPGIPAQAHRKGMGSYILDAMVRQFGGRKTEDMDNPVIFGFTYTLS